MRTRSGDHKHHHLHLHIVQLDGAISWARLAPAPPCAAAVDVYEFLLDDPLLLPLPPVGYKYRRQTAAKEEKKKPAALSPMSCRTVTATWQPALALVVLLRRTTEYGRLQKTSTSFAR